MKFLNITSTVLSLLIDIVIDLSKINPNDAGSKNDAGSENIHLFMKLLLINVKKILRDSSSDDSPQIIESMSCVFSLD